MSVVGVEVVGDVCVSPERVTCHNKHLRSLRVMPLGACADRRLLRLTAAFGRSASSSVPHPHVSPSALSRRRLFLVLTLRSLPQSRNHTSIHPQCPVAPCSISSPLLDPIALARRTWHWPFHPGLSNGAQHIVEKGNGADAPMHEHTHVADPEREVPGWDAVVAGAEPRVLDEDYGGRKVRAG